MVSSWDRYDWDDESAGREDRARPSADEAMQAKTRCHVCVHMQGQARSNSGRRRYLMACCHE